MALVRWRATLVGMKDGWYVAAESNELASKPLPRDLCGDKLVLFRSADGKAAALRDRCAHRGVALSGGNLSRGCLRCPYHGWKYDETGHCVEIPANLPGDPIPSGATIPAFPVIEQDGYIWIWPGNKEPDRPPLRLEHYQQPGWSATRLRAEVACPAANVVENFIDNPHTGYIHGGLFRTPASHLSHHRIRTLEDGVVIDIEEEAVGTSLLGRLLLRKGQRVGHQDRFIAPATVQVAYTFGQRQAIGWQFCSPQDDWNTRIYVHVTWSAGWMTPILEPFVALVGRKILAQDVAILQHQGQQLRRFGNRFCSTPADTANLWIEAYRRRAEAGQAQPKAHQKRVTFRV
ncbi:MAG: aromatic ring-hydroxylating dioxygenase subunit alpha [Cyanobacteria bacterium REEB65]|nr:aromatic ring-hydroxylating dioxygenase subunit alpha [Cyanobacteria bacterium REEB65]